MSVKRALFGEHRDPAGELTEIFATDSVGHTVAVDRAVAWARAVLAEAGVPAPNEVSVIAALRTADPRLGLKTATYLNHLLRASGNAGGGGR